MLAKHETVIQLAADLALFMSLYSSFCHCHLLVRLKVSYNTVQACVARYTGHSYQLCFTLAPKFTNELLLTPNVLTTLRWSSSMVYTTMQYRHTHKYTTTIQKIARVTHAQIGGQHVPSNQLLVPALLCIHSLLPLIRVLYTDGRTPFSRFSPWGWLLIYQVSRVIHWQNFGIKAMI